MSNTALSGRYAAYPEYKDSGVQWLGDVPQDWGCIKLKYIADLQSNKTESGSAEKYVGMENIESWSGRYIPTADVKPEGLSNSFSCGDILFGKLRPYLAKSWIADFSGICSSEFLVLEGQQVSPKFLNYYFLTEEFIEQVDSSTYGSKMPRASWDFISLMGVPVPPVGDSEKIANFLEHETAKIDTLIEKQQQLIKLLKEKRQAVISHAVTKGLNPDVPMRDSGVEWLGEIPKHWGKTFIKHISKIRYGIGEPPKYRDYGTPLIRATNIRSGKISDVGLALVNSNDIPEARIVWLDEGDIIVVRSGAGTGDSSIIPKNYQGSIAGFDMAVHPIKCLPEFLGHVLLSNYVRQNQLDLEKTRAAQPHLNAEELGECFIFLPSRKEQIVIVNFIERNLRKFDKLILKANSAIGLMQERRTALISAAVTGKIDVRNWQAPEPSSSNTEAMT